MIYRKDMNYMQIIKIIIAFFAILAAFCAKIKGGKLLSMPPFE